MNASSSRSPRRPPALPGPVLLLLPLLLLVLIVQIQRGRRPAPGAPPAEPHAAAAAAVEGWGGELELPGGGRVRARLLRLHADAERQAFDARSLRRRLALDEGEPWRVELTLAGPAEGAPLALDALVVRDAAGDAARGLPAEHPDAAYGLVDPLWGALAAPPALAPGGSATALLWGRAPEGPARLVGAFGEVPLFAEALAAGRDDSVLARLEEERE